MRNNEFLDLLNSTRAYLDYLEEHYNSVQKAWKLLQDKCKNMRFIYDDYVFFSLDSAIKDHDLSKFSKEEFFAYRQAFFPTLSEQKPEIENGQKVKPMDNPEFQKAWEHHKENNDHHWENWTKQNFKNPYKDEFCCVHMVVDWIAMGFKFNNTAKDYFEKNKDKIQLPEWSIRFINEIFERIYEE